jgi:multimeric flavodoxin WrbA
MRHNLMNCSVAIHCTLVVRNIVMVGCAEPWFTHALAIRSITRAEAARARAGTRRDRAKVALQIDQAAPIAKVDDRAACDAIVIGAGIRFGGLPSQMANFLDQAGGLWARGALHGKVGGAFTSTATQYVGQETTLFSIITNLLHFGVVVVGLDYGRAPGSALPGPQDRRDRKLHG